MSSAREYNIIQVPVDGVYYTVLAKAVVIAHKHLKCRCSELPRQTRVNGNPTAGGNGQQVSTDERKSIDISATVLM